MKAAVLCCTLALLALTAQGAPRKRRQAATCEINKCDTCANPALECAECPVGWIMASDLKACLKCADACSECQEQTVPEGYATTCITCNTGYTLNPDTNVCDQCGSFCDVCDNNGGGFCDDACTEGSIFNTETKTCDTCGQLCKACAINGKGNCDPGECRGSIFFHSGDMKCQGCISSCQSCTTSATACDTSGCMDRYYRDANGICQVCTTNCLTCTITGCDSCETGYTVNSNGLCDQCSSGCDNCDQAGAGKCNSQSCRPFYGYDSSTQTCLQCPANCPSCSVVTVDTIITTTCDTCADEFSVTNKPTCDFCPPNCNTCDILSSGNLYCRSNGCQTGYAHNGADGTCHACPANCRTCTYTAGATRCTSCNPLYAARSSDGQCYGCPDRCTVCTDNGAQTECTYNFCTGRSTYAMVDKTCPACPSDCASCYIDMAGNVACSVCDMQFTLSASRYACLTCPSNCNYCSVNANGQTECYDQQCDPGYILDQTECTRCPGSGGCASCMFATDGSLVCTTCTSEYAMDDSSTCRQCLYCKECTVAAGSTTAVCGTGMCMDGYTTNSNGVCKACPEGCKMCDYDTNSATTVCKTSGCYPSGRTQMTKSQCLACPVGCSDCSFDLSAMSMTCTSCMSGYVINNGVCHMCPQYSSRCDFQPVTGNTTTASTACATGYTHNGGNGLCVLCNRKCDSCNTEGAGLCDAGSCQAGYTRDATTRTCEACASNCQSCDTRGKGNCDTCKPTFVIASDFSSCSGCPTNCADCSTDATCTQCATRFALDVTGTCMECDTGCSSCGLVGSSIKCDFGSCQEGFVMNKFRACVRCPDGCAACVIDHTDVNDVTVICEACIQTGIDKGFATVSNSVTGGVDCHACPTECQTCIYDSAAGTTSCDRDGCYETFGFGTNNKQCQSCASSCGLCAISGNCDSGQCNTGWMFHTNADHSTTCLECATNCNSCTATGECSSNQCATGYALEISNITCMNCQLYESNCATCSDSTSSQAIACTSCITGYTLEIGVCVACSDFCDKCTSRGSGFCDDNSCQSGYSLYTGNNTCIYCGNNCQSCTAGADPQGNCETCDTGYRFDGTGPGCEQCLDASCDRCATNTATCSQCSSGFAVDTGNCYSCADNCLSCTIPGDCQDNGCENGFGYVGGVSANGTCQMCDSNCKRCDGEATTNLCNLDMCNNGYAWDAVARTCKLVECTGTVDVGTSPGSGAGSVVVSQVCLSKPSGCTVGTSTTVCPEGYCQTGFMWTSGTCTACPDNCATCQLGGECNLNGCKPGYGRRSTGQCNKCPIGCVECEEDPTTKQLDCRNAICQTGYNYVTALTCVACATNCDTCRHVSSANNLQCEQCKSHYTATTGKSCFTCQENCDSCTIDEPNAATTCISNKCSFEYAMNPADGTCHKCPTKCSICTYVAGTGTVCDVNQCFAGYSQHPTDYTCSQCGTSCTYCIATSDGASNECIVGGCDSGFSMLTIGGTSTCEVCPDNCKKCTILNGVTYCLDQQCMSDYGLTSDYKCQQCSTGCILCTISNSGSNCTEARCSTGYAFYYDDTDNYLGKCKECPANCNNCRYSAVITDTICESNGCANMYAMDNDAERKDCQQCPDKAISCTFTNQVYAVDSCEFRFTVSSDGSKCDACAGNCQQCSSKGAGKCDSRQCDSGYGLRSDDTCGSCDPNCVTTCQTSGTCEQNGCARGYYLDSASTCQTCVLNCDTCNSQGICTSCISGYTLDNADKNCYECTPFCHTCNTAGTRKCDLNGCISRYTLNTVDETCSECPNHCSTCTYDETTGKNLCTACDNTFALNQEECGRCPLYCLQCVENDLGLQCTQCMDRFTDYNAECIGCPPFCAMCTADTTGNAVCDQCDPGHDFDDNGACTACATLTFASCAECHVETDAAGTRTPICDACMPFFTMRDDNAACLSCTDGLTDCHMCMDRALSCSQCTTPYAPNFDASSCELECYSCQGVDCPNYRDTTIGIASITNTVKCSGQCYFARNETGSGNSMVTEYDYGCSADTTACETCNTANNVKTCRACCMNEQKCVAGAPKAVTVSVTLVLLTALLTLWA